MIVQFAQSHHKDLTHLEERDQVLGLPWPAGDSLDLPPLPLNFIT